MLSLDFLNIILTIEFLAMRETLIQTINYGHQKLQIPSDSQQLIRLINSGIQQSEIYGILQDIHKLFSNFAVISFVYVNRSENAETDSLAKRSLMSVLEPVNSDIMKYNDFVKKN